MWEVCYYRGFQEAGTSAIARSFARVRGAKAAAQRFSSGRSSRTKPRITHRPIQACGLPARTAENKLR